jgi:hypothetical protein
VKSLAGEAVHLLLEMGWISHSLELGSRFQSNDALVPLSETLGDYYSVVFLRSQVYISGMHWCPDVVLLLGRIAAQGEGQTGQGLVYIAQLSFTSNYVCVVPVVTRQLSGSIPRSY